MRCRIPAALVPALTSVLASAACGDVASTTAPDRLAADAAVRMLAHRPPVILPVAGATFPVAINDAGLVAGARSPDGWVWTRTGGVRNLSRIEGGSTEIQGVGEGGHVVGIARAPGTVATSLVVWTPAGFADLGTAQHWPLDVNRSGHVVTSVNKPPRHEPRIGGPTGAPDDDPAPRTGLLVLPRPLHQRRE